MRFFILASSLLVILVFAGTSSEEEEVSNLQIQVNSPDGGGFVHSAVPIAVRALGARLQGGKGAPTINDDVLVPYNDPDFQ